MKPLEPPDSHHLQSAQGWLELGNYAEANEELEKIAAPNRAHPDVLQMRWGIYAHARKWEACLEIATTLTKLTPDRRFGWVHLALSLHNLNRTAEARQVLLSVLDKFEPNSTIPYYLARYCSRLGLLGEARDWLQTAFRHAVDGEEEARLKLRALEEPDLVPMWKSGDS